MGKRNQFSMRIDMQVHTVGNGVCGSGVWLRLKGWHCVLAEFMVGQVGISSALVSRMKCSRGRANCLESLNDF